MVLKSSSVLSCLLPARFGSGSNPRPDSPFRPPNLEKHAKNHHKPDNLVARDRLGDAEFDPFRGNPLPFGRAIDPDVRTDHPNLSRARANTAPSDSLPPHLLIPNGDIGESPNSVHRSFVPPVRPKRSSFTTFFAFSSKRKSNHGAPVIHLPQLQQDLVPPQSVPGKWLSGSGQTDVQLINPSAIPSPLRTDGEEYYYSYSTSLTPAFPSHSASPHPGATNISPSERLPLRQQHLVGNPDLDSQLSSPVDCHPSHTQNQHPYAYSTPYSIPHPQTIDPAPFLRHATSQTFHHHTHHPRSDINPTLAHSGAPSSHLGHQVYKSQPHLSQPQLKTSISTPNLASGAAPVRARSVFKKRAPTKSKGQERWLSAETWWDALLSPSPRFKVKQASRPHTATGRVIRDPVSIPVEGEPSRILGVTFPSLPAVRPRAVSVTSNVNPALPALTRSWSATDLGQPSTSANPHHGFEPALETLVDEPTPSPDHRNTELSLPEPPISLEQVVDEGKAFEQQRAQWKRQASKSIGNRHTRSFSRARSKSFGERHVHGHATSEGSKAQFNLEFLAARSLLGSQSTMPTVHVIRPSNSSSLSKAYSHSHSQSAYSSIHTSHSRVYSHSHTHSLTTSNSSKSSRNPRGHSRSGSWSRTALLKAGALCGIAQDDSYGVTAGEKVPSSSRVDVQGTIHLSAPTNADGVSDTSKVSPPPNVPNDEVGIAISSTPPIEGSLGLTMSGHSYVSGLRHQGDQENRWSSKHTHRSSEYAGPHPSAVDSNLPQLGVASNVSLRHRLPPRAAIYPPITPITHPYRSASGQPEQVGDKASEGATLKIAEGHVATELGTEHTPYPHISISHADFERYGVGEALVYASVPRPEGVPEAKQADVDSDSSPIAELPRPEEHSLSCETVVLQHEELDTASMTINTPPSLTSSTIQMVMSAFNNPDDLDEFQDLFYKPHPVSGDQRQGLSVSINHVPTDVRSSASSSPLTHLVRKLSEEVNDRRDPSRTPSDSICLQRSESQDHPSSESGTKFVFMNLARSSSSPPPMESSSQMHVLIQGEGESTTQPVVVIPEDVDSSYTVSVLGSPSAERENDTVGYPIKHSQFEVATAPSPIQSPIRVSTHLSLQDEDEADETAFLSPVTKRYGLSAPDAVRSSCLTTSDMSQMSGLFDFPLPPSTRPGGEFGHTSMMHAYFESTPSESESQNDCQGEDGAEMDQTDRHTDGEEDGGPSGDVGEALQALRTPRVASYASHRTFGGSDDMDFITQLHEARP